MPQNISQKCTVEMTMNIEHYMTMNIELYL